ncbi:hypothetical protein PV08_08927 [Exophiala spinifera]|uniref:Retrovirus-related Pol polyprotein from transposon TNT 1-94-like beta-barrel domain-containing protein n=1 Tax=Exophiala spinifera TaxID=91928 RepID=A0A0D1YF68_9EURO|nr:uncharacterized protein PV08_08927 [Exophiala spinifera]KIW13736.1 hypothetical protein PV08_08927 [Exophiala spinifera]
MAKRGGTRLQALVTVAGTFAFIGAYSAIPRISITRNDDSTIIKYDHIKPKIHVPAPADPGMVISSGPKPQTSSVPRRGKPFSENDWIFDTGATTHVCSNRSLLHTYDTLNPYNNKLDPRAVGYFGPNPVPIVGVGDVTFDLPCGIEPIAGGSTGSRGLLVNRMTIRHVSHIPQAGVNLISWSQLKRAKGANLSLEEEADGSLTVKNRGKPVMRFEPRDGLFFLVQLPPTQPVSTSTTG